MGSTSVNQIYWNGSYFSFYTPKLRASYADLVEVQSHIMVRAVLMLYQFTLPVRRKLVWNETTWNLCHNITPEKRSMDKAHCLWIPVKLCCLKMRNQIQLCSLKTKHLELHGSFFPSYVQQIFMEGLLCAWDSAINTTKCLPSSEKKERLCTNLNMCI